MSKKALLVVSFGTSYANTRALTIEATEKKMSEIFTDYKIIRAFTSQMIINILRKRDGIEVFNLEEAFDFMEKEGYTDVLVQPLLIINGGEYEKIRQVANKYRGVFNSLKIGTPLLTASEDYHQVVEALSFNVEHLRDDQAVVFMGHGTTHYSNAAYPALATYFNDHGYEHAFVATVEGYPELEHIVKKLHQKQIKQVTLRPFMLVAGDHATNDMAGDEDDSWKSILQHEGFKVKTVLQGLGELDSIQNIFIKHAKKALLE